MVEGVLEPGFLCVGVPVGSDRYVKHMLAKKIDQVEEEVQGAMLLLGEERQALWTILRSSTAHKLEYWLGTVHPSLMVEAAMRMDSLLLKMLEAATGSRIPVSSAGPDLDLPEYQPTILDVPVPSLQGKSYQWWVTQLPVRAGGLGLRCQAALASIAYLGSVELCLPSFAGPDGICTSLSYLVGEYESDETRWRPLLGSNSRLGREFSAAWAEVKEEAGLCCAYIGEEVPEILNSEAEGFGLGAEWGSRQAVLKERERILKIVMEKALGQFPDQAAMPVMAWKNRDKLTTAFLLELPGPHNQWTSAEWGEALCLLLSLPANCCRDPRHLGKPIGDRFVDMWGQDVLCARLPGGGWTKRHDTAKTALSSLAVYSNLAFVCEPYSIFSTNLPQRPLHRLQAHQARQGLRPDFLLHLPSATGNLQQVIADVKTVSLGNQDLYKPGISGDKGVELRAAKIQGEYRRDALKLDRVLGFQDGQGPTTQKLQDFPPVLDLCFGAWGECSKGVSSLLATMVDTKLTSLKLQKGSPGEAKERSHAVGYMMRRLSSEVIRANVRCLISRMVQVGEGVGQAGKRRRWARLEEERARWSREAEWMVRVTGRGLLNNVELAT